MTPAAAQEPTPEPPRHSTCICCGRQVMVLPASGGRPDVVRHAAPECKNFRHTILSAGMWTGDPYDPAGPA